MKQNQNRNLDAVSVPDAAVDRLLAEFKLRSLLPFVKGRILDVGCGSGWFAAKLVSEGFTVEGVDGSPERITEVRLRVPSARFVWIRGVDSRPVLTSMEKIEGVV